MDPGNNELEEQEVTVEVVPQTVTEIIYLQDTDLACITPEQDHDDENLEAYEIGSVDITRLSNRSLVLDSSQSFVLLPPGSDFINTDTVFLNQVEAREENFSEADSIGEFICTICNYKCRSLSSLSTHRLVHDEQFVKCHYNCVVCGLQFDKAQCLSHHFRTMHEKQDLVCTICNCKCSSKYTMMQHMRQHEPKKFSCDVCYALFDSGVKLTNHKKTHSTTLLYACNICDASFSSTSQVSNHIRTMHAKMKNNNKVVSLDKAGVNVENTVNDAAKMQEQSLNLLSKKRKKR